MLEVLLAAAPLFALLLALLLGHYPGCDAVLRLGERLRRPRRRPEPRRRRPARSRLRIAVSGGLLLAFGLAQRPPPAAVTT